MPVHLPEVLPGQAGGVPTAMVGHYLAKGDPSQSSYMVKILLECFQLCYDRVLDTAVATSGSVGLPVNIHVTTQNTSRNTTNTDATWNTTNTDVTWNTSDTDTTRNTPDKYSSYS